MDRWKDFESDAPELAGAVRRRFQATKHHVLATLREDGSPRVSGTEVQLLDGELYIGMMPQSRKALDLLRDPRLALHANPGDGSMAGGDAKHSGRAEELTGDAFDAYRAQITAPDGPMHGFRISLVDVTLTEVDEERELLLIRTWKPGSGVTTVERH